MAGEALYERYKDALKRGHVASLRGRIDEALAAYAEAARIAPERSTPNTSAGTALMRRKRPADALRYYEAALRIGPRDEAAMLGRAQALASLDRRGDAADAFDHLAEFQAAGGKLADAVDSARRGLELAEGRERRRTLERLIERLRASEPGEPGRIALERALRVLEGPSLPARPLVPPAVAAAAAEQAAIAAAVMEAGSGTEEAGTPAADGRATEAPGGSDAAGGSEDAVAGEEDVEASARATAADDAAGEAPSVDGGSAGPDAEAVTAEPEAGTVDAAAAEAEAGTIDAAAAVPAEAEAAEAGRDDVAEPEPGQAALRTEGEPPAGVLETAGTEAGPGPGPEPAEPVPADRADVTVPAEPAVPHALDRPVPADVDLERLAIDAELFLDSGDPSAPDRYLDLAAASLRAGRVNTAIDACYQALALDPDDIGLHLALVQLYDLSGWTGLANEKLDLLDRLATLGGDREASERLAVARSARG